MLATGDAILSCRLQETYLSARQAVAGGRGLSVTPAAVDMRFYDAGLIIPHLSD
jgi:hypothetical protein